ncbi:RING_finger and CHY zinc finger domain-containing protein [Hexamita inflata]|uniref:RING finger and CHY zinc finger domain-containing protein n=1 Tax=Hexamita inflata TaxID=28002 RepID=A0AA86NEZ0_9EUKA|nr:RING finger and CHY zinc finger domain-containing protein [Hexamita inflata]
MSDHILVKYPDASSVQAQYQNKIVLATVFKLLPGSEDKKDVNKQVPLKTFPYQIYSEERQTYLDEEVKKIYLHMPLSEYDVNITDYECQERFTNSQRDENESWINMKPDQLVYLKFSVGYSIGCQHYIRGCQVKCETCQKFYPCRLCHNEVEDHEFPRKLTETVKCSHCELVQKISLKCERCEAEFGTYYCDTCRLVCGMSKESKPNFHCEQCGVCKVGLKDYNIHCDKCEQCYKKRFFANHKCISANSECIICLGSLQNSIYGKLVLECNHQMHQHCYTQLLQSGNLKCPVCKRFLPIDSDRKRIHEFQLKNYRRIFVPIEMQNNFVRVHCNDCQQNFVKQQHPYLYYCERCKLFNCDVLGQYNVNSKLKAFYIQFQLSHNQKALKSRMCTKNDVVEVATEVFECGIEKIEETLGFKITQKKAEKVAMALNKFPRTTEELKLALKGKNIDYDDEDE